MLFCNARFNVERSEVSMFSSGQLRKCLGNPFDSQNNYGSNFTFVSTSCLASHFPFYFSSPPHEYHAVSRRIYHLTKRRTVVEEGGAEGENAANEVLRYKGWYCI